MPWFSKKLFSLPYWLWCAIFLFLLITVSATFLKYYFFLYNSLDLAIFNHTLWQTIHGNILASSINPPSYLGDHFAPILIVLAPLYALLPHPLTLLFLQSIFISASAIPFYLIAKKYLPNKWVVLLTFSWLFNPFIGSLSLFEWHTISLLPFVILLLWFFFITNKKYSYAITLIVALLIREDVGITLAGLGIVMLFFRKVHVQALRFGLTTILLSLFWTGIALKITSHYNVTETYKFFTYYNWLTDSTGNITSLLADVFFHIATFDILKLLIVLLLPVIFLTLLSPSFIIGMYLPLSALLFSPQGGGPLIPFLHYSAWLLPFIYLGTIYGLKKLFSSNTRKMYVLLRKQKDLLFLSIITGILYFFVTLHPGGYIFYTIATDYNELSLIRTSKQILLSKIPNDAGIITTGEFFTPLSSRKNIHYLRYLYTNHYQLSPTPYDFPDDAEFILFSPKDLLSYDYFNSQSYYRIQNPGKELDSFLHKNSYIPLIILNDYVLLKKEGGQFFSYYEELQELPVTATLPSRDSFQSDLKLLGWEPIHPVEDHILTTLYFKKYKTVDKPIYFRMVLKSGDTVINEKIVPPSFGIVSTTRWPNDVIIKSRLLIDISLLPDTNPLTEIVIDPVHLDITKTLNRNASSDFLLTNTITLGEPTVIYLNIPPVPTK